MKRREPSRRRPRTGRTTPISTVIKPEAYDLLRDFADLATEREGRIVSMAEIIERGLTALEPEQATGS